MRRYLILLAVLFAMPAYAITTQDATKVHAVLYSMCHSLTLIRAQTRYFNHIILRTAEREGDMSMPRVQGVIPMAGDRLVQTGTGATIECPLVVTLTNGRSIYGSMRYLANGRGKLLAIDWYPSP